MKKRNLLASDIVNGTAWSIFEVEYGYQAIIKYKVLLGQYRTKKILTLTYAAAMQWIQEHV